MKFNAIVSYMLLVKYDGRCADTYIYGTRVYNVTWYGAVTAWAIVQLLALSLDALASTVDTA